MKKAEEQRHRLLALTIEAVGQEGLSGFSLRHLANAANLSTTAIFQNFSGKSDLMEAALERVVAQDHAFHLGLQSQVSALLSTHVSFADFLARYVLLRASLPHARFASELLIGVDVYPQCRALLAQWHDQRATFWAALLADLDVAPGFADVVAEFTVMEEFYAFALHGDCTYGLLLAETCRALSHAAFHKGCGSPSMSHVSITLNTQPLSIHEAGDAYDAPIKEQLLGEAVRIIASDGLEALNQRRIAKSAGVSTSAIAYYFNDMKTFRNQAVWKSLVRGIPSQLDPERTANELPQGLNDWLETLNALLVLGEGADTAGFYIGFARLNGQACLMARNDASLLPLITYLRALEGWGTYRVSRNIPKLAALIGRDHAAAFGMWIKSEALLRRANLVAPHNGMERLIYAAGQVFPQRSGA